MDIHEAATIFLDVLDPEHKRLILDCAKEQSRTPAAFILNCVKMIHDQGRTSQAIPETLDVFGAAVPPSVLQPGFEIQPPIECKWCHTPFIPTRIGQEYCLPPADGSEPCARKAALADIRASRANRKPPKELRDVTPPTMTRVIH